jgi:hypothetical protein
MLSEEDANTMSKPFFEPLTYNNMSDDYSISDADLQVSENSRTSRQNQVSHTNEGMIPTKPVTAGICQRGRVCTMSQRMVGSVSQQNFNGDQGMHYMSSQATTSKTDEDLFHDSHLQLQKQMRNPIAFHAEMMSDIMHLQQVLKQPIAKEFVQAVIKEVRTEQLRKLGTIIVLLPRQV